MKEDIKEKYMEYKMLAQQIQELQKQVENMTEQQAEVKGMIQGLDDLKKTKQGTEILFPISSGIFTKATIKDPNELLVNVGSNVVVSKDVESAKKLLEDNIEEIKNTQAHLLAQVEIFAEKAVKLEKEIEAATQ
ncbi:MAG: prefoldin subunit alpha [Nanoarchaeota archaeon]|nr:prefoldin subunit alpha [Nanoarchaeota archaeon]